MFLLYDFMIQGFSRELQRLERFARAACAKDRRYQEVRCSWDPPVLHGPGSMGIHGDLREVLPVIVPAGGEDRWEDLSSMFHVKLRCQ